MKLPLGFVIYSYLPIFIGTLLGAALGYFGQCNSGTCPLTSTWWRGAIYGALMGSLLFLSSQGASRRSVQKNRPVESQKDQPGRLER